MYLNYPSKLLFIATKSTFPRYNVAHSIQRASASALLGHSVLRRFHLISEAHIHPYGCVPALYPVLCNLELVTSFSLRVRKIRPLIVLKISFLFHILSQCGVMLNVMHFGASELCEDLLGLCS